MTVVAPESTRLKRIVRKLIPLAVVVCVVVVLLALETPRTPPSAPPASSANSANAAQPPKPDPVLATVNGEAIRESDVAFKMSDGTFALQGDDAHDIRLKRMVRALCLHQLLAKEGIQVVPADIDSQVEELRKYPPSAGCICCRYQSLEQFMEANYYDLKELRSEIANDIGLQKHLDALWLKEHPAGDKTDEFLRQNRVEVEKSHVKVSHIFLNTFQNPDFEMDPVKVRRKLSAKADDVFQRIQKGEAFEKLAKDLSEDSLSRPKGGELGCIPFDTFGRDAEMILRKLKPGETAKPIESPYGFHIFRRETLEDKDVLEVAKAEFVDIKRAEVLNLIWTNAKIEYKKE